ncbi:CSN-associated deubiquitinating enzyme Ubp12, partial [Aspergillus nanangensis]
LTVTTSSTKRRKVAEPRRPGAGLSFVSQAGRRHSRHQNSPIISNDDDTAVSPSNPRPSSSASNQTSSSSPPPRYIPAHLQDEVLGTRSSPDSAVDSSSAACAGLSLSTDPVTDNMSGAESRDASPSPSGQEPRSQSPGLKATASQDVEMDTGSHAHPTNSDPMDTNASDNDDDGSDNVYPTPSSMSISTAPSSTRNTSKSQASSAPEEPPSYDDQVAEVTRFMMMPIQEKQKGYVVSCSWLKRVLSRSSTHAEKDDKSATEGDVGPVDNSDLVLVTDPANVCLKDEAGEPFVPLRPGLQISEDYEVVPPEGWDLMMKWYGLAEQSPAIIRYAHNTSPTGDSENIQYEINPPIFTILKLPNPTAGISPQTLREKSKKPIRTLASRHTSFQKWLKEVKGLANIDMSTKVRVWKILGGLSSATASAAITPAASRSASPAPAASMVSNTSTSLLLDLNTFLSLSESVQRELVDVKDQTANSNYNGKSSLDYYGLGGSDVVVLEEQVSAGGEWASETSKKALSRLGVPAAIPKDAAGSKLKNKTPSSSGRSSPVTAEPIRGRRKDGKPRGNTGLSNLGNTCYMNSALQCVRSVEELAYYFLNDLYKKDLNFDNPLGHNGEVAKVYANLIRTMYDENGPSSFAPRQVKNTIGRYGPAFSGYGQQDSQEFLLFLLDGLQEDLNRILKKPYIEKPDSTDEMVHNRDALEEFANKCWDIYKARNDSVITDLFAGMYKSTLICPVCDKVSIIFDPFNNLTLQLPIENTWRKEIYYFAVDKKPVVMDVEIDKQASIKSLKELVAKKMDTDAQRLIMCDMYKNKFYKTFDNTTSIAESQITGNDDIAIFEVDTVPTNYNPDKPPKSHYSFGRSEEKIPDFSDPAADQMLVPIFHRTARPKTPKQRTFFGVPSYIVVSRKDAYNYDVILKKILGKVATMTTRDFLNEEELNQEDSDTVIMTDDDAQSGDSKIKTSSVDGEDGMVDVSMLDESDQMDSQQSHKSKKTTVRGFESAIPSRFWDLFTPRLFKGNEVVPLGWSSLEEHKEYPKMEFRIKTKPVDKDSESNSAGEQHKSEDDSDQNQSGDSSSDDASESATSRATATQKQVQINPIIRPGEGILLDWTEEAHDALFGDTRHSDDGIRGAPTWANVERVPDPELEQRRKARQLRRKNGVSLDDCLDEFNKKEILSENNAWYCPRCKEHRLASKKFELWKTPDILVMHLKRFSASRGFRDKLDVLVDFPVEGLDLTGRVEAPEDGKSLVYDLFAVDNHYGGLGGGHYTAYAKNFMTGKWNEYNDSHVSGVRDPQSVVSSAAYLLFYRRRSERPLGGKVLQDITESSTRPGSETESRDPSPSGDGRRLGGSSRSGSPSALTGAGAARRSGDGGSRTGTQAKNRNEESSPEYTSDPSEGEKSLDADETLEGMNLVESENGYGVSSDPFRPSFPDQSPMWSFDRITDTHGPSQMTAAYPGSISEDDNLLEDDASNKAVGGGDLSDSDLPLSPAGHAIYPGTPMEEMPPLEIYSNPLRGSRTQLDADQHEDDDDDDDMPVVELRVDDDDRTGTH